MIIKAASIKTDFDSSLIEISPLKIRRALYKIDDKNAEETQELQFQIKNISDTNLAGLDAEFEYSSLSKEFEGFDSDLRLEPLKPNETHNFSMFIDPPEKNSISKLKVKARKQTLYDKIPTSVTWAIIALSVVVVVYSKST